MSYGSQRYNPEIVSQVVSPMWAVCAFLSWWDHSYCCSALVGRALAPLAVRPGRGTGLAGLSAGHACWCQQVRGRISQWLPPVSQSPGGVPTGSCLSGRCFKISKWVSFTCDPRAFQSGVSVLVFVIKWVCVGPPLQLVPRSLQFCDFPGCILHWFSEPGVWVAGLVGAARCGAQIPVSAGKRFVPL